MSAPRRSKVTITAAFFGILPAEVGNKGELSEDLNRLSLSHWRCSTATWYGQANSGTSHRHDRDR